MGQIYNLFAENENSCWITAADGLINYTEYYDKKYNMKFDEIIKQITTHKRMAIYFFT